MALGFVLIHTKPAMEHDAYVKLLKIPQIVGIFPLFGEYDLIAKIEVDSLDKLRYIVLNNIRNIAGVIDTKTLTGTNF